MSFQVLCSKQCQIIPGQQAHNTKNLMTELCASLFIWPILGKLLHTFYSCQASQCPNHWSTRALQQWEQTFSTFVHDNLVTSVACAGIKPWISELYNSNSCTKYSILHHFKPHINNSLYCLSLLNVKYIRVPKSEHCGSPQTSWSPKFAWDTAKLASVRWNIYILTFVAYISTMCVLFL